MSEHDTHCACQGELARLRAEVERLTKERDEAKCCPECRGTGRAMVQVAVEAVGGEWVERMEEDECMCCEGKGQDR